MPQTYGAGAIFILSADAEYERKEKVCIGFELSSSQLSIARRAMEMSHKIRHVPAGSEKHIQNIKQIASAQKIIPIDDSKLQYTWSRFRSLALAINKTISSTDGCALTVSEMLAQFEKNETRLLLKKYRAQYDRRFEGSDEIAKRLRYQIYEIVVEPVKESQTKQALMQLICH